MGIGLLLVAAGGSLLVTNLVGLWLATRIAPLAPLVVGSWPMLLCGTGIAFVIYAMASRMARRGGEREARHAR
jgi:hypothetical protein